MTNDQQVLLAEARAALESTSLPERYWAVAAVGGLEDNRLSAVSRLICVTWPFLGASSRDRPTRRSDCAVEAPTSVARFFAGELLDQVGSRVSP